MSIILCRHCGNRTPHREVLHDTRSRIYEEVDDEEHPWTEDYETFVLECGTCRNVSIAAGFRIEYSRREQPVASEYPILYPAGPDILPAFHTISGPKPVIPDNVMKVYQTAWPLRMTAPSAFANQIRRALEFVCQERGAEGKTLYAQLQDLAARAVFPRDLAEVADLVREVGNRGSHAGPHDVDTWDAELLDELFRSILRYVYLVPAHARRMRERLGE